ncbi:hypothetical protein KC19_12G094400 [Ceratodon purpureus]|uniref:Kinesin motor domain-containing protein n=1 Tax=Ceratodon purpureus TaxID=3225 RepID=A0A8T0G6B0_CERPU|nr:hypothetical protein KC19_12G094400 [Ceratodon purpureus]
MSRVPPPRLCVSPIRTLSAPDLRGAPMNGAQPDPPIRELRNRWPFFSEGELKWLLSPKRSGSGGHSDFGEDIASDMAARMANAAVAQQEMESCPGPVPSESPVALQPVEGGSDGKGGGDREGRSSEVRSSFTFLNDRLNKQGVQCSSEIGSLGPRSLMFQDIAVASGADDVQGSSRVGSEVEGEGRSAGAPDSYGIEQNGHLNPFHMNPFVAGLDGVGGEGVREEPPVVFVDGEGTAEKGNGGEGECSSDEHNTAQYFTPSKEVGDQEESPQNHSEADGADEEDDDEEEEVMNSAVKRMSFALEDGKQLPKFSPDDVVLAINCGGLLIENESHGISFKRDEYFTGGDVLRTEEEVTGVHDASLYQTSRYGNVSYVFRELPSGNYVVDLHFAEIIFTNGPPGMRVFDVTVQDEKVISGLDVYEEVGSNNALILSVSTSTADGNLTVAFEGVTGVPTISAICIRSGPTTSCTRGARKSSASKSKSEGSAGVTPDSSPLGYEQELLKKDKELRQITEHKARRQQAKKKTRKSEYEARLKELTNECHEAWISLQDSNRMNEMLRDDLCAKSICVDSLATAVENQLSEMNAIKERSQNEKQRWLTTMSRAYKEIMVLKEEQRVLSSRAKEWVASFPDPTVMTASVRSLLNEHQDLRKKYADECYERKLLYNKVLELKGNIRVFCRCRPLSQAEAASNAASVTEFEGASNGDIVVRNGAAGKKLFKFDRVFSPQDDQTDVFADTAPVVVSVLDGYNVCIFAYGQTGTGKTFTMEGSVANRGVNYRTLEELFNVAAQRKGEIKYDISVSVMEVYNEQIRDLLAPPAAQDQPSKKLEIKQAAEGGHHVPGLVEAQVSSMEEVWDVLQAGSSSRTVGSTRANDHSSRSHCMLCVMVKGENVITGEFTKSKLWLVDLAGSERVAKSDAQGDRLKEAQNINKSLSALGDVIQALTMKSSHIPFRNSKLTHLLQDSLGGDSKTLMFVQISPNEADVSETLCSLNFASRVRGVELGPARKHLDSSELFKYKQLAEKTKQESRSKDESARRLEEKLQAAEAKLKAKEQMCQALSDKVKEAGEVDVQLLNERRARQAAEAMYRDQKATMERMAAESKLAMEKLADRSAAELRHAKDALAAEAKQAKDAVELRQAKDALAAELKQAKEALQSASAAHAKEVSRLLQQLRESSEVRKTQVQEPAAAVPSVPQQVTPTVVETVLRRPALVEAGCSSVAVDRTPTLEYVVRPPDASEVMRNSCTGEVFANENAAPQQNSEAAEAGTKAKGILKQSSGTKYISPGNPAKRVPGRARKSGFAMKPAVQVNSLVRRSHESLGSSCNSVAASLSEEELQRLCGGVDMMSTFDASLQTLAHVLESTPISGKGSRPPAQAKSVHFRSPLLLPPRDELETRDNNSPVREAENTRPGSSAAGVLRAARRTTLPSRPLGMKAPAAGPHRVVAAAKAQVVPVLREKRWN